MSNLHLVILVKTLENFVNKLLTYDLYKLFLTYNTLYLMSVARGFVLHSSLLDIKSYIIGQPERQLDQVVRSGTRHETRKSWVQVHPALTT